MKSRSPNERAKRISVSDHHFRRLLYNYRKKEAEGIISGHRGRESSNRIPKEKRENILKELVGKYQGFGPTLISEKLFECKGIKVSKETVRQILITEGLHTPM